MILVFNFSCSYALYSMFTFFEFYVILSLWFQHVSLLFLYQINYNLLSFFSSGLLLYCTCRIKHRTYKGTHRHLLCLCISKQKWCNNVLVFSLLFFFFSLLEMSSQYFFCNKSILLFIFKHIMKNMTLLRN